MNRRNLTSLGNSIRSVVAESIDTETKTNLISEGYINSLTEKARQTASQEMEEEGEDEEEMEDEEEGEEEEKPLSKKKSKMMKEEVELTEKAAPGYEDWASDPKVKSSFKKQYGNRWKEVMYAKSWKMSKMDEETELEEGLKRLRRLRTAHHLRGKGSRETADVYDKELAKVSASRLRRGGAPKQTVRAFFTDKPTTAAADKAYGNFARKAMSKASAKGKKIFEEEQLDELTDALISRARNKAILRGPEKRGFVKKATKRLQSSGAMAPRPSTSTERDSQWNKAFNEETDLDEAVSTGDPNRGRMGRVKPKLPPGLDPYDMYSKGEIQPYGGKLQKRLRSMSAEDRKRYYQQIGIRSRAASRVGGKTQRLFPMGKKIFEDEQFDEAYQAKRMRVIRKAIAKKDGQGLKPEVADFMKRSFKKKRARDEKLSGGKGAVKALEVRMKRRSDARKAKHGYSSSGYQGLPESEQLDELSKKTLGSYIKKAAADIDYERTDTNPENEERVEKKVGKRLKGIGRATDELVKEETEQLDEAGYTRLMRLKKAAYEAGQKGSPSYGRKMRAAAERESQVAAGMARRGGASPDAVRGGGSRIGKSGKYTQKAGALANQRDKALAKFRSKALTDQLFDKGKDKSEKRKFQQAVDSHREKARSGDFGQDNQTAVRARSNYQKRFGRLKGN